MKQQIKESHSKSNETKIVLAIIGAALLLLAISCAVYLQHNSMTQLEFYKMLVLFLLEVCVAAAILVLFIYRLDAEKVFSMLALFLGFLYLITITPLSVPDEPYHYHSAYWLSNKLLFQWDSEYGNSEDFDYSDFVGHYNVSSGYVRILEDIGEPAEEGTEVQIPNPKSLGYFVEYLPQAFGITLARITNQNFVRTFMLGRLFNLIFYAGCLYLAIKQAPIFKTMFGLIGIMPMSLHQAASYSYDGFINGMSLLLLASILKAIYEEGLLGRKDFYYIVIPGMLLAPAKVVYFSIALLAVLIPCQRFGSKRKKIMGITIIWAIGVLFIIGFQLPSMFSMATRGSTALNWEGQHNYTLSFILEHPIQTIEIFANTFWRYAIGWLRGAVGQTMSGLTLGLPSWIISAYICVIMFSALSQEDSECVMRPLVRACMLAVSMIMVWLIMLSLFLGWTSDSRTIILGIQGRYFIPVIPLLALSLNNQVLILRKNIDRVLIMAAVLLQCYALNSIVDYTLLH